MNLAQLIDQFELVTDTEEGLPQLRNLILNLAFRGDLVRKDSKNKSGKKLLEGIRKEKQRMYDNGEIRKPKELTGIDKDEMPFDLPNHWTWCRLGDVYHNWGNKTPDKDFKYIDVSSINNEKGEIGNNTEVISPENAPSRAKRIIKEGTVLYSTVRPYLLNVAIYEGYFNYEPIASTAFEVIHPLSGVFNKYVYYYLRSPIFTDYVDSTMVGVAYPAVNKGDMIEGHFPLPPPEEQKRIVRNIETLFARVDELEQKVEHDRAVDERLQVAVLDDLQQAQTPEASRRSWQRLTQNFEQIYRKPEHIAPLKQAILNEAVRGRLVAQDPSDEPAEQLLERITEEKQRLYEEGEIRKPKDLPEISDDEIPYALPEGWTWARMGTACSISGGKRVPKGHSLQNRSTPYIYIRVTDMKEGTVLDKDLKYISKEVKSQISKYTISKNDLYITIAGTIGDVGSIPEKLDGMNLTENAAKIQLYLLNKDYLQKVLNSPVVQLQFFEKVNKMAQPKLALKRVRSTIIPLPPLEEQEKIIGKVDELFSWCDDLKSTLHRARQTDRRLLEALASGVD